MPPYYPALHQGLTPAKNSHLARMQPILTYIEAVPRRQPSNAFGPPLATLPLLGRSVVATVLLPDPRRQDGTAYLGLLHCVNDTGTLKVLLDSLGELLRAQGCRRVIGPTGLSPHLGSGLLQDYWSDVPPLHTPYNPPYMPEVVGHVLRPLARSQLYHLDVPPESPPTAATPAKLTPLDPSRLSSDLLPLFVTACPAWPRADFPPPDEAEAEFLLRQLGPWPLWGWLAELDDKPVGFVLLQPDLAPHLKQAGGGRRWWWRLWLAWAARRRTRQGRLLFMAVSPEQRRQGVGSQLLRQALALAREQGWQRLTSGPIPSVGPANKFLQHHGATPRQTYLLYQQDL